MKGYNLSKKDSRPSISLVKKDTFIERQKSMADKLLDGVLEDLNSKYIFDPEEKKFRLNVKILNKKQIKKFKVEEHKAKVIADKNPNFELIKRKAKILENEEKIQTHSLIANNHYIIQDFVNSRYGKTE